MTDAGLALVVRTAACAVLILSAGCGTQASDFAPPSAGELSELVGQRLDRGVQVLAWTATDPPGTSAPVYSVRIPKFDPAFLRRLAAGVGIKGGIKPNQTHLGAEPGYWIEDLNPTNSRLGGSLVFSTTTGEIAYCSNDHGESYDKKAHRPVAERVPEPGEAHDKALALLPLLGLSTNDLQLRPDGRVAWRSTTTGVTYTDRDTLERKRLTVARHIVFDQRMEGGKVTGVGGGGQLRVSFVSEGKLHMIEVMFRRGPIVGQARPRSRVGIISALNARNAWSWNGSMPEKLTVTNCMVVYPQGNGSMRQEYLWPFYAVAGTSTQGGQTNAVTLYVPLEW
jgi:hypothetical protein